MWKLTALLPFSKQAGIIDFGMLRNAPCFANTALRCGDVKKKQAHRAERKGPLFQAGKVWPTSEAAECPSGL